MGSDFFGSSDEDELAGTTLESRSRSERPVKRRKLNSPQHGPESGSNAAETNDSPTVSQEAIKDSGRANPHVEEEAEQVKPKSKYKIHIPKNPELPTDAFFTQPPQRSPSPYRIDKFHWRKPKKSSPLPSCRSEPMKDKASINPRISTTPISAKPAKLDGECEARRCPNDIQNQPDTEFDVDESYGNLLADLPSDAFSSQDESVGNARLEPIFRTTEKEDPTQRARPTRLAAPIANLRQTTLFGTQAQGANTQTQTARRRNWPLANREEPATHHKLDRDALKTWVYPTNLGTIRDYQFSIVARGLYHNMLVALPTGLGKTFIAAAIMLNWFRWTSDAQIVFVAPTKPLVSQQVRACFEIAGIPRSVTTMLTGGISPGLRAEEWNSKRVFFMTPQTIVNDLKTGICDPKRLVLLVVDEAHRATGGYAYVEVVKFLRRFNPSFRVLALTATPGASIESVQEVIDGLGISKVEIRTEESIDIRQYVHPRKIETVLFENSEEMVMVMDLFSKALQPVLDKLNGMNAYWARDPMTLTPFGCNQARQRWMASDAGRKADMRIKGMVNTIFSLLASLSHGIELLKFHGIGSFYHKVLAFRNEIHDNGKKGGKYSNQINDSEPFQTMMSRLQIWINNPDFVGHPKLVYLQRVIMNHFLDAGDGRGPSDPSSTRVMVFSHYRDSAEEIARILKMNEPMIRPHVFVGQANSKGSGGMDQKTQLETIKQFQRGIYNTLVATSIGEEGLDIGEVDLIICYDASASPIRMLQRMGRTGRKRAGNIVVTLMKGKEENNFIKAKDSYEKMQVEIASGARFNFHEEESRRIVPKDIQPVVDKRIIEIPLENTQQDLPEPTKRGRAPKRPSKKFHMPDGVRIGFVKASKVAEGEDSEDDAVAKTWTSQHHARLSSPAPIPSLEEVLLTPYQEREFERRYLDIKGDTSQIVEIPRNDAFPSFQRSLRPAKDISHGRYTQRMIHMLASLRNVPYHVGELYENHLAARDREQGEAQAEKRARFLRFPKQHSTLSQRLVEDESLAPENVGRSARSMTDASHSILTQIDNSSSDELDGNGSIRDLIDGRAREEVDNASSKSSPPPLTELSEPFYQSQRRLFDFDHNSEDELPDIGTLVETHDPTRANSLSRRPSKQTDNRRNRGRGARNVVQDDSDYE